MPVYMIQAGKNGPVKIGWTKTIQFRVRTMQSGHYEDLSLIRVVECDREGEKWFHYHFADHYVAREWYRFTPEMLTTNIHKKGQRPRETKFRHPLTVWLYQHRETLIKFTKRTGLVRGLLTAVMLGVHEPTDDIISKVTLATGGDITRQNFSEFIRERNAA